MTFRTSLMTLSTRPGPQVVRPRGTASVVDERNPRVKGGQE